MKQVVQPHRSQWKSRIGFLLAAIGSAVGLGNIWRFPYLCYKNGGGVFLFPYLIALFTAGIPLMLLEIGIGHKMRGSASLSFAKVNRRWEWLGWWAVTFVMFGIVLYYCVIISWCLNYLFFSFNLSWGNDPNDFFFNKFLRITDGPHQLGEVRTSILFGLGLVWFINWLIVFFGIQRGVERANRIFMPILFLLTAILVFWSLTLKGAFLGLKHYLKPDFNLLANPQVWIDAYSQAFFSLSLGFGIMVAYASYLPHRSEIVRDSLIISFADSFFSIFAGCAVFSVLGYMATSLSTPLDKVVGESVGLAFVVYPQAISLLPVFSHAFGVIFFAVLVVAGFSSSISILEAFSVSIMDKFGYSRRITVTVVSVLGFFGGIVFSCRGGLFWLDIVDHFLSHYGLITVGILECILIGWIFKASHLREHVNHISSLKLNRTWDFCIRVLTPVVLVVILINNLIKEFTLPYGGYSWLANILIGRDWLIFTLFIALLFASRPWRKQI